MSGVSQFSPQPSGVQALCPAWLVRQVMNADNAVRVCTTHSLALRVTLVLARVVRLLCHLPTSVAVQTNVCRTHTRHTRSQHNPHDIYTHLYTPKFLHTPWSNQDSNQYFCMRDAIAHLRLQARAREAGAMSSQQQHGPRCAVTSVFDYEHI